LTKSPNRYLSQFGLITCERINNVQKWRVKQLDTPVDLQTVRGVLQAAHFAAEKHSHQKRKGSAGEPYINHLIEVAELVAASIPEPDMNLIIAALLHDTIEDTATTQEELIHRFGSDVADLVAEVTDDKTLLKHERKRLQIETAPKKSARAQVIKLADKISNLRAILYSPPADWDLQRKQEYFFWAQRVVNGFTAPNPTLKAEFDATLQEFNSILDQGLR
jgi:guanosine-3',5'-bis(diphosphate) 3'-pyrophosphohydrolase